MIFVPQSVAMPLVVKLCQAILE